MPASTTAVDVSMAACSSSALMMRVVAVSSVASYCERGFLWEKQQ
jgi:hypothetical protein